MFCKNCGSPIMQGDSFCTYCGTDNSKYMQTDIKKSENHRPLNKKIIKIIIPAALSLTAIIVAAAIILSVIPKRMSWGFEYSEEGIESFLDTALKNLDAQSAKIKKIESGWYGGYYAIIDVKLKGKVKEQVYIEFYNMQDNDKVTSIYIRIDDDDTDNKLHCIAEVIKAIEITITGKTGYEDFKDNFEGNGPEFEKNSSDEKTIARYELNGMARVNIIAHKVGYGWYGDYSISKTLSYLDFAH